jgi:SSS family solute:Na+ symporter
VTSSLDPWQLTVLLFYFAVLILISVASRKRTTSSNDYLNASKSLPVWAASLAFLAYNCGSIEVIGMSALAAQYGVQALHFYWVGGIPGMIFFAIVALPVYLRTGARSLPEYLGMRFGPKVRLLSACISMAAATSQAGAILYAMSHVLHVIAGGRLVAAGFLATLIVLIYVLLGGIRASIYTSVFQLFVMVAGLVPVLFLTVHFTLTSFAQRPENWHLWRSVPWVAPQATLDRLAVLIGLGFVISFSYWCTDFVLIQRAFTARSIEKAQRVPLIAGFGKLAIGLLVVLPGAAAPALLGRSRLVRFDDAVPQLLQLCYGPTLLGLGIAALLASLMAGFAGNISGFAAVWTEEIYRIFLSRSRTEEHYIRMGRWAAFACFLLAIGAAGITLHFQSLMEFLLLVASLLYAPLFAIVLAGIFSLRISESSACAGILLGFLAGALLEASARLGAVPFGSQMSANFYIAILSFSVAICFCLVGKDSKHLGRQPVELRSPQRGRGVLFTRPSNLNLLLSGLLFATCVALNALWW